MPARQGIRRLSQGEIDEAKKPLFPKGEAGPESLMPGIPFIRIAQLEGYKDLRQETDYQAGLKEGMVLTDAFGQPGGPGIYVGRDAWSIAYAKAELARAKRPRFKPGLRPGGGGKLEPVGVRSTEQKKEHRQKVRKRMKDKSAAIMAMDPDKLTPAQSRRRDSVLKGQAKAKQRNLKRLAKMNAVLARKYPDIPPFQPDATGIPQGGWEAARAVLSGNRVVPQPVIGIASGGLIHAQGGGLFKQIPEISGGSVRGARTTVGARQKRERARMKSESIRKWNEEGGYTGKGNKTFRFGPLSISRTSQLTDWASGLGSGIRRMISGETPAEKTGRMGLGHGSGYGGMKDPRWGMGGADYMHMQERRALDLHGYQQGGSVIQRGRQWDNTRSLRNPPTMRGLQRRKLGPFLPSPTGIFGAMGNIMRRKWGMESPAEKTGRLGLGHTTGYGGMKDPRRGMGGADYMYTKERDKGFHGYNRGGNVDSVSAKLTPGEFVMRREAVRKYGERFMNDVNLQKLNQGGRVGGSAGSGQKVVQSQDLERGAKLAGDSILNAFTKGSQMVGDAIREALSAESLAEQIGSAVSQKMQESLAATSIEMQGNMGVDVRLTGNGATGDISSKIQEQIKNAIAETLNNTTNVDGSAKDPSLHRPALGG